MVNFKICRPLGRALAGAFIILAALPSCGGSAFSRGEKEIIRLSPDVMRVYTIWNKEDSLVLRTPSKDLDDRQLRSEDFRILADKMLATVTSPEQDGVGIAAPQVGINRRVICVWREDKPEQPFEVYANVRIDSLKGEVVRGPEGCLSVPPYRGIVPRHSSVTVSYTDPETLRRVSESVSGYSAIIFQHECDHLDGILYIDKADSVRIDPVWAAALSGE